MNIPWKHFGQSWDDVLREEQNLQRLEAMKVLLPERTGTPEMAERFRREIRTLASLNHPN